MLFNRLLTSPITLYINRLTYLADTYSKVVILAMLPLAITGDT
jgi:hypothetical protein